MKKNILLIILLFLICLTGCVKSKNMIKIKFIMNDYYEFIEIKKDNIVTEEIIPIENKNEIEGIFYDSNYTSEYNNEPLMKDTTLYVKVKEKIEIIFKFEQDEINIKINKNEIINESTYSSLFSKKIEGLYYDEEYTQKYNSEPLIQDTILYVKERTFEVPTLIDAKLCKFSQNGLSGNDNTIISTYEQFCQRYYYDDEAKKAYYERGFIYEEDFFNDKALVLAYYSHSNRGNFVVINEVIRHNNKLTIKIDLATGFMTAIASELILVEVNKEDIDGVSEIVLEKNVVDGQKVKVTYIIEGIEYYIDFQKLQCFSKEVIVANNENFKLEDIEGLYLDKEYKVLYDATNPNNDYYITEDTIIYVKLNK